MPRLVFRDTYATGFASVPGYASAYSIELDYEDICAIWGVNSLPGINDISQGTVWNGKAQFYEDGSIAIVELMAYNNPVEMDHDVMLCHISLCPGTMPQQTTYFSDETPTCTFWDTPITALDTGNCYQGDATMAMSRFSQFYLRFMTSGAAPIGLKAQFYAPDGRVSQTKELMNKITGYCLDPEGSFSLDAITQKVPDPRKTDSSYTQYIPEAFDNYHMQSSRLDTENGSEMLRLYYTEMETGGGIHWAGRSQNVRVPWKI